MAELEALPEEFEIYLQALPAMFESVYRAKVNPQDYVLLLLDHRNPNNVDLSNRIYESMGRPIPEIPKDLTDVDPVITTYFIVERDDAKYLMGSSEYLVSSLDHKSSPGTIHLIILGIDGAAMLEETMPPRAS